MKTILVISTLVACIYANPSQPRVGRIGGGQAASSEQFPYVASLQHKAGGFIFNHVCAVAIVSPSWSITAAQCRQDFNLLKYRVVAGILNQGKIEPGTQITNIDEFILHPNYHSGKGLFDIALLLHSTPFDLTNTVKPISLPKSIGSDVAGNAVISGWGSSTALQYGDLQLLSQADCSNALADVVESTFDSTQTCANEKVTVCNDDIGSPVVQNEILVAFHSWSASCDKTPAVFVRVDSHIDFVLEHVKDL